MKRATSIHNVSVSLLATFGMKFTAMLFLGVLCQGQGCPGPSQGLTGLEANTEETARSETDSRAETGPSDDSLPDEDARPGTPGGSPRRGETDEQETLSKTFVGQVKGTGAFIALVTDGDKASAYVCGESKENRDLSGWFSGQMRGDEMELWPMTSHEESGYGESKTRNAYKMDDRVIVGAMDRDGLWGYMTTTDGDEVEWWADPADEKAGAGLYMHRNDEQVSSIIVTNDEDVQGLTRSFVSGSLAPIKLRTIQPTAGKATVQIEITGPTTLPKIELVDAIIIATPPELVDIAPPIGIDPPKEPAPSDSKKSFALHVKFLEGTTVRLIDGQPKDRDGEVLRSQEASDLLARIKGADGEWTRAVNLPERRIAEMRRVASKYWGETLPDLNLYFTLRMPTSDNYTAREVSQWLVALKEVEDAFIVPQVALLVPNQDYSVGTPNDMFVNPTVLAYQGYLDPAVNSGVDARYAWGFAGGAGEHVQICNFEHAWNLNHLDLPNITQVDPNDEYPDDLAKINHGTASLGVVGGLNNGWGVRGIAHNAGLMVSSPWNNHGDAAGVLASLTDAVDQMAYGDVMMIILGVVADEPVGAGAGIPALPMEWHKPAYDGIRYAVGNGITVLEGAGNGEKNLDLEIYSFAENFPEYEGYSNGFNPFLVDEQGNRVWDSGAIIVGAGQSPMVLHAATQSGLDLPDEILETLGERKRSDYSSFGKRVDVQGWGDAVVTTGGDKTNPGDLYNAEGEDLWFTNSYGGTSSATPIVAGCVAVLQSISIEHNGYAMTPYDVRELLIATGTPQQGDTSEHVGPLPNLRAAIDQMLNLTPSTPVVGIEDYCNGEAVPEPRFTPEPGMLTGSDSYEIEIFFGEAVIENAAIFYTTNGGYPEHCSELHPVCGDSLYATEMWTPNDPEDRLVLTVHEDELPFLIRAKTVVYGCDGQPRVSDYAAAAFSGYIPPPIIGWNGSDIPSGTYSGDLYIQFTTAEMGGSPYVRYTLDGTDPDDDGNIWDGTASSVWTNTMTANGNSFNVLGWGSPVTVKAQTFVYSGDSTIGYLGSDIVTRVYTQAD